MKMENDAVPTTGPCASGIKKEKDADPTAGHSHSFSVKFPSDTKEYTIVCDQPGTVLQAIKTCHKYDQKFPDENPVIQLGKKDKKYAIATHFPCICIREDECLILSHGKKKIEWTQGQNEEPIQSREMSSVFSSHYRRRRRNFNKYFNNNSKHQNKNGRTKIHPKGFFLGNFTSPRKITRCILDKINYNKFKKKKKVNQTINVIQNTKENNQFFKCVDDLVRARNRSVGKSVKLRNNYKELEPELIKLGESVCKVVVRGYCEGTGFVLFDNLILTNAHLFKKCVEEGNKKLKDGTEVEVIFNFEEGHKNHHYFQLAHLNILYCHDDLDYAILELQSVGQKYNPETETNKLTEVNVPPGLLERFGPMPKNGEVFIIGHPGGGVKKYDRTSIIEIGNRKKAVHNHLEPYKDTAFIHHIMDELKNQNIKHIYVGGKKAHKVATYKTLMHHGSSGSPVIDANNTPFGLHTSGFVYVFLNYIESVIECAQPLLTIFADFVSKLMENWEKELLKRVKEVAKGNPHLENILKQILNPDSDEPMEID